MLHARKPFEQLKHDAVQEYITRGKPAMSTKWSVSQVLRFMKWKLAHTEPGSDLGGMAEELPKAMSVAPAPLPDHVVIWENSAEGNLPAEPDPRHQRFVGVVLDFDFSPHLRQAPLPGKDTVVLGIPDEFPHTGYDLEYSIANGWFLKHRGINLSVRLPLDMYCFYTENGMGIIVGKERCRTPVYCVDILTTVFHGPDAVVKVKNEVRAPING